jgi:hypothetical protein
MPILVPALLLLAAPAQAAPPAPAKPLSRVFADCHAGPTLAQRAPKAERPQKLGELPPGRLYLTVVRTLDGCPIPAMSEVRVGR